MKQVDDAELPFERRLRGRRVLVTGHSGFTGSWISLWLSSIGAEVFGYALQPETNPALSTAIALDAEIDATYADIRDIAALLSAFARIRPDAVVHLAAQPLVRRSYREPVETFAANVIGTAHVLEAARRTHSVAAIVCVTTDKVYRSRDWIWPYREDDALGGKDPYSASKAASEMVIDSYRASFGGGGAAIGTARGGNIIGGGDWSEDRLVPDFVRAVVSGGTLTLRYPQATRPWQHVLALAQGYLMLLAGLFEEPERFSRAWNFGPLEPTEYSVRDVFEMLAAEWRRPDLVYLNNPLPEALTLRLDSSLARQHLGWHPPWDTQAAVQRTAEWYRVFYEDPTAAREITRGQLDAWRRAQMRVGPRE